MKDHLGWRKSTRCDSWNSCVQVRHVGVEVEVRDSKDPSGPVLSFSETFWDWVLERVTTGEPVATIIETADGVRWWNQVQGWVFLDFTAKEWAAFVDGAVAGEFDLDRLAEVAG